jgi:hypothetical protein
MYTHTEFPWQQLANSQLVEFVADICTTRQIYPEANMMQSTIRN